MEEGYIRRKNTVFNTRTCRRPDAIFYSIYATWLQVAQTVARACFESLRKQICDIFSNKYIFPFRLERNRGPSHFVFASLGIQRNCSNLHYALEVISWQVIRAFYKTSSHIAFKESFNGYICDSWMALIFSGMWNG